MPSPLIRTFVLGPYLTNCFVVTPEPAARRCWIVDCGFEPQPLLDHVQQQGLQPAAILLTHCHSDHMAGLEEARRRLGPLPVYVHRAESGFCSDPMQNLSALFDLPVTAGEPDHVLDGGEQLELDGTSWEVVHAPGHSPGGVLYVHRASNQAIVGDTLFAGSIGRHDFPTSDVDDLRHTIREVLMSLPDEMTVYPGHGPSTTIGQERRVNPFVVGGF